MNAFALPAAPADTEAMLRDLEQTCPRTTPKEVREALLTAAKELQAWKNTAQDCVRMLEEASKLRVGQMDSHSRADEVHRQVKRAMSDAAAKLRARM